MAHAHPTTTWTPRLRRALVVGGTTVAFLSTGTALAASPHDSTATTSAGRPALRHQISREDPLILLGYYPGTAESEGGTTMAATWAQLPDDLRDNVVVNLIPDGVYPGDTRAYMNFVTSGLQECQAHKIPCSVQALHGGSNSVAPADFWRNTAAAYSSFVGLNVAELYWGNVAANGPRVTELIQAAGESGLILTWTDTNHGNIMKYLEDPSTGLLDAMRANSANVVLMNKETEANVSTDSLLHGLWLAGVVGNWGSATDQWHWAERRHRRLFGPETGRRTWKDNLQNPEALMAQSIQRAAASGATAYAPEAGFLMFSTNNLRTAPFQYAMLPLFRDLDSGALPVPTRAHVLAGTRVVYKGAAGFNPPTFDLGASNVHPTTGRFGILPLVPRNLTTEEMSVFPEVVPSDARYPYFDERFPKASGTSNTFLLHSGDAWHWNNYQENKNYTLKSSFKPEQSRASAVTLAAGPHTHATVVESPDRLAFRINNYRSNRDHLWTDSLYGVPAATDLNRQQSLRYIADYLTVQRDASGKVVRDAHERVLTGSGRTLNDRDARDVRTTIVTVDATLNGHRPTVDFEAMDPETTRPFTHTEAWDAPNARLTITITHNGQVNFTVHANASAPESPNIAMGMPAVQSSDYGPKGAAANAVDGSTNGDHHAGSTSHTGFQANPWWMVDLGQTRSIGDIEIWNRTDCCGQRLSNYTVSVLDNDKRVMWSSTHPEAPYPSTLVSADGASGRYVRVQLEGLQALSLAEVKVRPHR